MKVLLLVLTLLCEFLDMNNVYSLVVQKAKWAQLVFCGNISALPDANNYSHSIDSGCLWDKNDLIDSLSFDCSMTISLIVAFLCFQGHFTSSTLYQEFSWSSRRPQGNRYKPKHSSRTSKSVHCFPPHQSTAWSSYNCPHSIKSIVP